VIEAAGVSRATFYIYFESKHATVAALAEAVMEPLYANLWVPLLTSAEPTWEALLADHWIKTLAFWREHQAVLVATAEAWRANPAALPQWGAIWSRYVEDIRAYIERARAAGDAPTELDAEALASLLVWMNENALYLAFTGEAPELADEKRLATTMSGVWMRSIYGSAPSPVDGARQRP
jgi:AcrR family transcriptional regulator